MMKHYFTSICLICFLSICAEAKQSLSTPSPSVYFNHLYIVLENETYEDVAKSKFLQENFANFNQSIVQADGGTSWTGTYIYGERTYLELFSPKNNPDDKPGMSGIAFGVEQEGEIEKVYNQLNQIGGAAKKSLRTAKEGDKEIPWFYTARIDYQDTASLLSTWVMEYHKDFLKTIFPDLKSEQNGITRKQYLMRAFKPERYLKDISEVTIALNKVEADRFVKKLRAFGYKIKEQGAKKVCQGSEIKFIIVPQTITDIGVTQLKMSLLRSKEGEKTYRFGARSKLELNGKTAVWTF